MNRRLRIPVRKPPLPGEPLPLHLSAPVELRLQLVGADASIASVRGRLAPQRTVVPLTAALGADAHTALLERPIYDRRTH